MKLSTRTRYGIRAALELAMNYGQGPLQIKVIAGRQDISVKYLEQIMTVLKTGGFIRSVRGAKGGYMLSKNPEQITVKDILIALEGQVAPVECVTDEDSCSRAADCVTHELWSEIHNKIMHLLESKTLKDLVERAKNKRSMNYQI